MTKQLIEFVISAVGQGRVRENNAGGCGKDIEYMYIFSPRESGIGFYTICQVNLNPAVQAGFHWKTGRTEKCGIPRSSGLLTKRYARQVGKGVCLAERALAMRGESFN